MHSESDLLQVVGKVLEVVLAASDDINLCDELPSACSF